MAGWTSLSPNFCEVRISSEDHLFYDKRNTLEDNLLKPLFAYRQAMDSKPLVLSSFSENKQLKFNDRLTLLIDSH
jgi:hypothetical protein